MIKMNKLMFFLILTGMVDFINGICLKNLPQIPFGQVYRLIFLCVLLGIIARDKKDNRKIALIVYIMYFFSDTLITVFYHNSLKVLVNDLIPVSRLLLIIMIILAGKVLIDSNKININHIEKVINFNMRFITISLLICKILNLGNSAYNEGVGFKGFYNSNNELSIVLSLFFIYVIDDIYKYIIKEKKYNKMKIIDLVLIFISLFLIGAKTSYIVIIITIFIYIIRLLSKLKIRVLIKSICLLVVFIGIVSIIINIFSSEVNQIIEKFSYQLNSKDLVSFILSDRNNLWDDIKITYIQGNVNIFTVLFGFRKYDIGLVTTLINIELDGNLIFINYGIIGLLLIISFFIYVFKSIGFKNISFGNRYAFVIYILFALAAGHVFIAAFAGTFLAIHCIKMELEAKEYYKSKVDNS